MAFILTFLGKGGTGRTTLALAAAHKFARAGQRVLLMSQDAGPALEILVGQPIEGDAQAIAPNLYVTHLRSARLLEESWDEVKKQEAQYLKTPFFKEVYGQELGVLPGMDPALALNAIREQDASGQYDVILYDGDGYQSTLRMFGMPEILSWYTRRFQKVFAESDLWRNLSPFAQPIASSILNVDWSGDLMSSQPANQAKSILEQGKEAIANPQRVMAYLVTTERPDAIATARYLWGASQQVGLSVGGVLVNQASDISSTSESFAPIHATAVPHHTGQDWAALAETLPDFQQTVPPAPITLDLQARQVRLFLPGFTKQQVKLTQYGPEVTIEAGDQRRNIFLPAELRGRAVTGAKFQDSYLIITFG
ncbi:MAG: ArsA family ATPase [Elainellaceae cyanobacterium]